MWWEHWMDDALGNKVDGLVKQGIVSLRDGQLHINTHEMTNPNWLHITGSTDCRCCMMWNEIMFKHLGIIHSFCRYHCYKVVIRPRTVRELIQVHNLFYVVPYEYNFINPIPGKAGLDLRRNTGSPYGAFNYTTSLVEALRVQEVMYHMVTKYMPEEEIDGKFLQDTIFVKRSCTEMEAKHLDNPAFWDTPQTADEWEIERRLEEIFKPEPDMSIQPAWVKDRVLQNWLSYANSIGDKSAIDFLGADLFNVHSRKYMGKDLQPKRKGGDEKQQEVLKEKKRAKRSKP